MANDTLSDFIYKNVRQISFSVSVKSLTSSKMFVFILVVFFCVFERTFEQTDPRCPPNNDGLVVHLPHEYDCTKFYKCDWGVPVLFDCQPPGTHWSIASDRCEWPNVANCQLSGSSSTSSTTSTSTQTTTTVRQTDPRCPPNNDGLVVHLPHEYDCTKFYKCDWGIPVLFDCQPPGTHWRYEHNIRLEII